jgi:uncharacterized membrane protein
MDMTFRRKISMTAIACVFGSLALVHALTAALRRPCSAPDEGNAAQDGCRMPNGSGVCDGQKSGAMSPAQRAMNAYRASGVYGPVISVVAKTLGESHAGGGGKAGQVLNRILGDDRNANCPEMKAESHPGH